MTNTIKGIFIYDEEQRGDGIEEQLLSLMPDLPNGLQASVIELTEGPTLNYTKDGRKGKQWIEWEGVQE